MADIKLTRPAAGQYVVIPSTPDARMVLDFSADQVSIDRPQGSDSLFFRFEDGSGIELQNFYAQYSKEDIPSFEIDGQLIAGADFFNAFGPDLVPAAGPAASATRAARYADLTNSNLIDGVKHLDGLDIAFDFGGKTEPILDTYASPFLLSNSAPSLSTGGGVISMNITEAGVGKPHMAPLTGSFTASDPDGDSLTATVTMGDTSVAINGVTRIVNNYGTLIITPVGSGSNVTYQYSYEVNDNPVDPLFKATDPRTVGADSLAQGESHTEVVTITLRDSMGHVVTQSINITITGSNDAPDIRSFDDMTLKDDGHFAGVHGVKDATNAINPAENAATENGGTDGAHHLLSAVGTITAYDPDHGAVLTYGINTAGFLKDASGHDSSTTFTVESYAAPANGVSSPTSIQGCDTQIKTEYGTLYLNSSTGKYEFVVDPDSSATNKLAEGQSVTLSFMPTVTDEHGAVDNDFSVMRNDGTPGGGANGINITIMGSNDVPVIQSAGWTAGNVVTEDSNAYLISGKVVGTDVDANETSTLRYGFFHPDGSGSGSVTLENTLYVVASGTASDGSPQYSLSTSAPADGNFYGKLAIDQSSGNYSFELNNAASCVQALDNDADKGSSLGVTFPVVVKDDFGAYSTQNVSLTINGVNDAPQFLSTGSASYAVTVKDVGVYAAHDATGTLNAAENDATLDGGVGDGQHKIEAHGNIVINDVDNGDNTHTVWGVTTASGQVQVGAQSTALGAGKATTTFYVLADDSVTTKLPKDNNYYGTLTVKDDGSYSFKANTTTDSPVDKMGENATPVTITINLYANDGQATTTSSLSITIKGSNDAPTVDTNRWAVHDDGNPQGVTLVEAVNKDTSDSTVSGTFVAKDVDVGDTLHYGITTPASASQLAGGTTMYSKLYVVMKNDECKTVADPPSAGTYSADSYVGEFKLTETGSPATGSSYSFTLYNGSAAVQGLQEGVNKTASVTLVAQDNNGAYVKQDVSVTIKGSNDTPTVTPPAAEAAAMSVVESGVYQVGTNYNAKFDGIPKSEAAANTFTVSDVDNGDTQTVSISIKNGADNDVSATMQADGNGKYTIDTPEGTFTLTAAAPVAGTSGSSTTYTYSYALDNDRADTQSLNAGEERNYTFTVTVTDRDGKGATTHQDITLKITGTNDKPILQLGTGAGPLGTAAHETGENTPIIGSFTVTDVDADGASLNGSGLTDLTNHKISLSLDSSSAVKSGVALSPDAEVSKVSGGYHEEASITTNYGVLTVKPDGTYSFTPKADFLDKDDQVNLKFNLTVTDRHDANDTKTISVTLKGENDDPTGGSTTPVDLAVVESGESYGDGGANYYNYLRDASTTKNPKYIGKSTDGSSFTVKDVDANDTQKVSLQLDNTTVTLENDNGDLVYHGQYGDFIITPSGANSNKDGSYTPKNVGAGITYTYKYVLDDAKANSLGATDDIVYNFKVVVTDSNTATTSQGVNVHVDAVNDIPRISWSSVGVSEAGLKNGNNTFADTGLATGQIPGGYTGGVYDPDNATNTLTFKVAGLTDGQNSWGVVAGNANGHGGAQLARNITGTDESGASITRAETVSILGQYSATEDGVAHQIIVTNYGVLNLNTATGSYTFNIKPTEAMLHDLGISDANIGSGTILNNINHLAQDEKLSFSFQATVTDPGNLTGTHMIGINIAGTNDNPTLTLGYASTLVRHTSTTDTAGIAYEQLEIRDVKNNIYGAVTDTQRGYTLGNATSTDADAHSKAYFGAVKGHVTDGSGTLTEAGIANSAINTTQSTDTGASTNYVTVTGDYGTLKIDANGNYFYTMDKTMASKGGLINKLTASQHLDDSFTVLVKDEFDAWTTKAITVRIDGVNDNPYLLNSQDISGTVTESGNGYTTGSDSSLAYNGNAAVESSATVNNVATAGTDTIIGKFHVADDDSALAATTPFTLNPSAGNTDLVGTDTDGWATYKTIYGYFRLNPATGEYEFKLDNTLDAVQALQQGSTAKVDIPIVVSDADGGKLTFNYSLSVKGTNDKPELTLSAAGLTITDGLTSTYSPSGSVSVADPDTGDTQKFGIVVDNKVSVTDTTTPTLSTSATGTYGKLTYDAKTLEYKYTLTDNLDVISQLDTGEDKFETFTLAVMDSKGAFDLKTVTVTITGKEDPTIVNTAKLAPAYNVIESGVLPTSATDDKHVHNNNTDDSAGVPSTYGYIGATDADTTDNTALGSTAADAKLHYVIEVTDHNGTATTNDGIVTKCDLNSLINATNLRTATKDDNGHLTATDDIKVGDAVTVDGQLVIKLENGSMAITIDKSGNGLYKYTYTLDNSDADVQKLNFHETGKDGFTLLITDSKGKPLDLKGAPVTINIEGANDRPIITAVHDVSINENTAVSDTGQLSISDPEQNVADTHVSSGFNFSLVSSATATTGDSPVMQGTYGRLVLNQATGEYQYYRTADLTGLNDGDSVTEKFYVRVMDKDGAYSTVKPITITINGVDQPGTMHGGSVSIKEDGVTGDPKGVLHYTTADKLGANTSQPLTPANTHITGKIDVSDLDDNKDSSGDKLDGTGPGDTYSTFTYGTGSATLATVLNGQTSSTPLTITHATGSNSYTVEGYGTLTVASNGSYSFDAETKSAGTLSETLNHLAKGETVTITLPATTHSNAKGAETMTGNIVVTISGTNDVPVVDVTKPTFTVGYTDEFTGSADTAEFKSLADSSTAIDYLTSHKSLANNYVASHSTEIVDYIKDNYFFGGLRAKGFVKSFIKEKADADDYDRLQNYLTGMQSGSSVSSFLSTHVTDRVVVVDSDETASLSKDWKADSVVRGSLDTTNIADDVDHNADLKFFALSADGHGNVVQQIHGTYGMLVISPSGTYQYVLDRAGKAYGEFVYSHSTSDTTTETFTIYVRDEHNAVAVKPIDLIINVGSNGCYSSGPGYAWDDTIKSDTNSVTEDVKTVATGHILEDGYTKDSDLYLLHNGEYKTAVTTDYGTITLLPDGSYSYVLNNDHPKVQQLGVNDTITETFTVTNGKTLTWDGLVYNKETITITIHGTNDTPYVVSQGGALAFAQGAGSAAWSSANAVSSFVVNDVDNGDTAKLILTGTGVDGSKTTVINGVSYEYSVAGSLGGTFYVHKTGTGQYSYTYQGPANNYKGSAADSASVYVTDPTGAKVEVKLASTLTATNDTPVLNGVTADVTEDGGSAGLMASGSIAATDVDKLLGGGTDSLTYKIVGTSGNTDIVTRDTGTLMMQSDGSYKFYLNNSSSAVQSLGANESTTETFTVAAIDGSGSQINASLTVTIHGTNDVPVLSLHSVDAGGSLGAAGSGAIGYVTDGAASMVISGKAVAYDADANDTLTLHLNDKAVTLGSTTASASQDVYAYKDSSGWHQVSGNVTADSDNLVDSAGHIVQHMGQFVLNNTGSYTFTGDSAGISHMGQGEKLSVGFDISVEDGVKANDSGTVTVFITGTNDKPVVTEYSNLDLTDNGTTAQSIDGTITGSDVDGDNVTYYIEGADGRYTTQLHNEHGTLKLTGGNKYTYTMDSEFATDIAALADNSTTTGGSFNIVAVDNNGAKSAGPTLNITLWGVNDTPTLTITPSVTSVTEDSNAKASGTFALADVDSDGSEQHLFISSSGPNNKVVLDIVDKTGTDAIIKSSYGTLTMTADGTYSYELNNDSASVQALMAGESYTDTFTVYSEDSHRKASGSQTISVTINGTNDTPVVNISAPSGTVTEDGPAQKTASGTFSVVDADLDGNLQTLTITSTGNSATASQAMDLSPSEKPGTASVSSNYGTLALNGNGTYSYELINSSASVQGLKAGESYTDQFTVVAKDSSGINSVSKTISVVINGTNDAPVVASVAHDVVEGSAAQLVALAVTDAEHDALTYVISYDTGSAVIADSGAAAVAGSYGSLTMDATGHYSYAMDSHALSDGQHATEVFHVTVNDGQGGTTTQDITFNLTGVNDVPVAHAGSFTTMSGQLVATDADAGETASLHYTGVGDATFGHVTVDANGTYHYDLNIHSEQGVDAINSALSTTGWQANSTLHDGFLFTASDAHTTSNPARVDLDISATVTDAFGGHAVEIGTGASALHLVFGSSGNDFIDLSTSNPTESHVLYGGGGDDTLYGGNAGDYLFGGAGVDHLYGGAGNDFLDGGTGTNILAGGDGNDILVHHDGDVISGGSGIDVLLTDNPEDDLSKLLDSSSDHSVEVAIKATDADPAHSPLSLTDSSKLAAVGSSIDGTARTLSEKWAPAAADDSSSGNAFNNANDHLALSTNLAADTPDSSSSTEVAKFILNNS